LVGNGFKNRFEHPTLIFARFCRAREKKIFQVRNLEILSFKTHCLKVVKMVAPGQNFFSPILYPNDRLNCVELALFYRLAKFVLVVEIRV